MKFEKCSKNNPGVVHYPLLHLSVYEIEEAASMKVIAFKKYERCFQAKKLRKNAARGIALSQYT